MIHHLSRFQPSQIEKYLWHGTPDTTVRSIKTYGFNRSFCGRNGEN